MDILAELAQHGEPQGRRAVNERAELVPLDEADLARRHRNCARLMRATRHHGGDSEDRARSCDASPLAAVVESVYEDHLAGVEDMNAVCELALAEQNSIRIDTTAFDARERIATAAGAVLDVRLGRHGLD